ncbi:MAG: AI-2E family transporter [Flavobacteriales bacterium]|nr:AI-2E family transporter [Flavobacteriales bacterium]
MKSQDLVKSIIILSAIALIILLLFKIRLGLLYIFISIILTLIITPFNKLLKNKLKMRNSLSSLLSLTMLISFLSLLIVLFVPVLTKQGKNLSLLNTLEFREKIQSTITGLKDYFETQNISVLDFISDLNIISEIDFSFVTKLFNSIISQIGSFSIGVLSVMFITFFLLKDGNIIFNKIIKLFPKKHVNKLSKSFIKIEDLLTRYFIGVSLQILILFSFYLALLLIIGIENAFAIAFICAILNIIPYLGPLISIILMIILSVTSSLDIFLINDFITNSFWLFTGFVFIQLIDNFLLQPYIFSSSVKSHPLEVFIVIISAGLLFGIFGLIIAIPVYTTLKVIYQSFFDTKKMISNILK